MKYRKKPVEVEAFKWTGFPNKLGLSWMVDAILDGVVEYSGSSDDLKINTLEGTVTACVGDFIIKGVNGEVYPCKPDIFEKTYEAVED